MLMCRLDHSFAEVVRKISGAKRNQMLPSNTLHAMDLLVELGRPKMGIRKMPSIKNPYGMPSFCLKFSHFSYQFHWHTHNASKATAIGHMKKTVKGSNSIMGIISV